MSFYYCLVVCEHGNLKPGKSGKRSISKKGWKYIKNHSLQGSCKQSRTFTCNTETCLDCVNNSIAEKEAQMEYKKGNIKYICVGEVCEWVLMML